jgi:hypothetical protein
VLPEDEREQRIREAGARLLGLQGVVARMESGDGTKGRAVAVDASWHLSLGPTREQLAYARGVRDGLRLGRAAVLQLAEDEARIESGSLRPELVTGVLFAEEDTSPDGDRLGGLTAAYQVLGRVAG